ncbi:hypothetical protein VF13_42405 [Nostoc linckia z16]|nr:hypothetical protein VF13_42405 [Nostoc linckia z16]
MDIRRFELPQELKPVFKKARKLEWITFIYTLTVVVLMAVVMGTSQTMKSATLEDALSMVPSLCFLIGSRFYDRQPNKEFPYGYHRVFGIAFLAGSLALFGIGAFLLVDSSITLLKAEHPTIGSTMIFGHQVWMGYVMMAALVYSFVPSVILGYMKLPLSKQLHNKILFTDADTQKADYMTAIAAIAGIMGIGMGWWWADSAVAIAISVSILHDGIVNVKTAVLDLMDRAPVHIDDANKNELVDEVEQLVRNWHWVQDARVRFREHGQVLFGEVYVMPKDDTQEPAHTEDLVSEIKRYNWKLHDVVLTIVDKLPEWEDNKNAYGS